jgi:hypothetical protein
MTWDAHDWKEQDGSCLRCHTPLSWEGDLPESEADAICRDCAWEELHKLRVKLAKLEPVARHILANMTGTCDLSNCKRPSFAGFMHGMCEQHGGEFEAPVVALNDQTLLLSLQAALEP